MYDACHTMFIPRNRYILVGHIPMSIKYLDYVLFIKLYTSKMEQRSEDEFVDNKRIHRS